MAHKLPRGRCVFCGRSYALTALGRVRKHPPRGYGRPPPEAQPSTPLCPGSGQRPSSTAAGRRTAGVPRSVRQLSGPGMIRRPPPEPPADRAARLTGQLGVDDPAARQLVERALADADAAELAADDDPAPAYEHQMRQPCGCPLDSPCSGYHPGALDGWPP